MPEQTERVHYLYCKSWTSTTQDEERTEWMIIGLTVNTNMTYSTLLCVFCVDKLQQ